MIDKRLNYSKVYFIEKVRDELISSLKGDKIPAEELKNNLDRYCQDELPFDGGKVNKKTMWDNASSNMWSYYQLDYLRRMVGYYCTGNINKNQVLDTILDKCGGIDANDYKIHVTFFCQEFDLFPSFSSVWKSMEDNRLFDRQAVFVYENKADDPTVGRYISENYENYLKFGIPVIDYKDYSLTTDQPDICFYMKPYYAIRGIPPKLYVREVNRYTKYTVYISYCLDVQGGSKLYQFFYGMPAQYSIWKIIGYSQFYKDMACKYGFRGGENVEVIGHPKFDEIFEMERNKNKWVDVEWRKKIGNRPVILWNTHFSITPNAGVGTFLYWYKDMRDYFKKNNDIFLIWRPHPIFWQTIEKEKTIDQEEFREFCRDLEQMDNVIINKYGDYHYSFAMSDALISDAATFLVEYVATEKPVMYTPKEGGEGVIDENCIKDIYIGDSFDKIAEYCDMVKNHHDPLKNKRMESFYSEYGHLDGKNGERIRDYIIGAMHSDIENDARVAVRGKMV